MSPELAAYFESLKDRVRRIRLDTERIATLVAWQAAEIRANYTRMTESWNFPTVARYAERRVLGPGPSGALVKDSVNDSVNGTSESAEQTIGGKAAEPSAPVGRTRAA